MKLSSRHSRSLLLALSLASGVAASADDAQGRDAHASHGAHYACPPCGNACDHQRFAKPGSCPYCGMKLQQVQEGAAAEATARPRVAILLFDGVEIIDYTGPYEVFGAAQYQVFTVAETHAPITTAMGMTVVPHYAFTDAPRADILVVPGGGVAEAQHDAATLRWVREQSARARQTMSVCNGAFILASAGLLLDGMTVTTTYQNLDRLRAAHPGLRVVGDRRYTENGKLLTTAGLSAGIDGALRVVEKFDGLGVAQQVALAGEYDWRPRTPFVRGALADRLIPKVDVQAFGDWKLASTEGSTDHWEVVLQGTSPLGATQLRDRLGEALAARGQWKRSGAATGTRSTWSFRSEAGEPWTGELTVTPEPGAAGRYTARLRIARAGHRRSAQQPTDSKRATSWTSSLSPAFDERNRTGRETL